MERKIGEIFEYNGEWYQCVKGNICNGCSFNESSWNCSFDGTPYCSDRSDEIKVIFKKLEKVGKPYAHFGRIVQRYKGVTIPVECSDEPYMIYYGGSHEIDIEIKNKENMEENKMNLKPFDLEAARSGKPVCTRDGRKARVICFDVKGANYPILTLVEECGKESTYCYDICGKSTVHTYMDLMMLPEKHEGWINLYNADTTFRYVDGRVYKTKDEAVQEAKEEVEKGQREKNEYIDTIKIAWEE